jgi:hypothetical protein
MPPCSRDSMVGAVGATAIVCIPDLGRAFVRARRRRRSGYNLWFGKWLYGANTLATGGARANEVAKLARSITNRPPPTM